MGFSRAGDRAVTTLAVAWQALMSLFVLSSKDGWVNIMYDGLDAVGIDQQVRAGGGQQILGVSSGPSQGTSSRRPSLASEDFLRVAQHSAVLWPCRL